jgi:hypothetical protein
MSFDVIDVVVWPNPREGWLNSSWRLREKGAGAGVHLGVNPLALTTHIGVKEFFDRADNNCCSSSLRRIFC